MATGLTYAGYALMTKALTRTTRSVTIALSEMVLDVVFLLPLAAWQMAATGFRLTTHDLGVVLVLALVCTAVPYVIFVEGIRRIRVEHASILGYLEPLSAPLYALLLLGEGDGGDDARRRRAHRRRRHPRGRVRCARAAIGRDGAVVSGAVGLAARRRLTSARATCWSPGRT